MSTFVKTCETHRLSGVEALAGIPGTVGGAIFMNAGAFAFETSDHLMEVSVLTSDCEVRHYSREEVNYEYRRSNLPPRSIVLDATFRLVRQPAADAIRALGRASIRLRKDKQPLEFRSLGSMFKNPANGPPAGKLIDEAGLKGASRGNAQIWAKHGNFIVNKGAASAADVRALLELAHKSVKEQLGIDLELEVKLLGFDNNGSA